ncbi:lipid II:glycine glycyltransferase FemX [Bacteroidota bacterium]
MSYLVSKSPNRSTTSDIGFTLLTEKDEMRWNNLLNCAFNASYRASIAFQYSKYLSKDGIQIFVFHKNDQDIAGALYALKKGPSGLMKIADIQSGTIFRNEKDIKYFSFIINHFISWAKENKASYIRLNPWLPKTIDGQLTNHYIWLKNTITDFGFNKITDGKHTYWIDLQLTENELLSKIHRSNRKIIRRGLRSSFEVDVIEKPDQQLLKSFWDMYSNLSSSKGFDSLEKEKFFSKVENLFDKGQAYLFVTRYNDEIANITMTSNFGVAAGMYGAINPGFKKIENYPSPGPLSVWKIITTFKKKGLKIYDMGFCPGRVPIKGHPNYNVWVYKYSFGGIHVQFMPTYGKIIKPLRGRLFEFLIYRK